MPTVVTARFLAVTCTGIYLFQIIIPSGSQAPRSQYRSRCVDFDHSFATLMPSCMISSLRLFRACGRFHARECQYNYVTVSFLVMTCTGIYIYSRLLFLPRSRAVSIEVTVLDSIEHSLRSRHLAWFQSLRLFRACGRFHARECQQMWLSGF